MSFFQENFNKISTLKIAAKEETGYRECQVGAAWATLAHFTSSKSPALISMPTGSGKTALMMILSFLLKANRVFIIEPVVILRDQTAEKFASLKDLREAGLYIGSLENPKVHNNTGKITNIEMWQEFRAYDAIVATPHTMSPEYEGICAPPDDFLTQDTLLFVDEAHHSSAKTWRRLIESFRKCKIVLLTATPFRNDKRRLMAKLIYHYPIHRAIKSSIYSKIKYHNVICQEPKNKDRELSEKAKRVFEDHRKKHPGARLLVRAEGVKHSKKLLDLYTDIGLKIKEVNYKKTLSENQNTLEELKKGNLDGIICIDQIGEGLDVPSLKVAVLHKPKQSFPATIQFIGRICRKTSEDAGEPQLIACADDVKGRLRQLYLRDNAWEELIPELIDKIIDRSTKRVKFHEFADIDVAVDILPEDLEPFFSVRVYNVTNIKRLNLDTEFELDRKTDVVFRELSDNEEWLTVITETERNIPWASKVDLKTFRFDLHVFYLCNNKKLFFEYTTADSIASEIRKYLGENSLKRLEASEITNAIRAADSEYLMLGLSSLAKSSGSLPSYKTYVGNQIENAIRITDGRTFIPGHALARYPEGKTRGIGCFQGRVWSIKRGPINEFIEWCDDVAKCLSQGREGKLPNVEFLSTGRSIKKFPSSPYMIYCFWDPRLSVTMYNSKKSKCQIESISFSTFKLSDDKKTLLGNLLIHCKDETQKVKYKYSLRSPYWDFGEKTISLIVDKGDDGETVDLKDFLAKYPPVIFLKDGGIVKGGTLYSTSTDLKLSDDFLDSKRDWSKCDIYVEFEDVKKNKKPLEGFLTIHDQLEEWLKEEAKNSQTLIIKDHSTGEIADFITLNFELNLVSFYHCKACTASKKPGARICELKALEQALRSINYVSSRSLLKEISQRIDSGTRKNTKLIKGDRETLEKNKDHFRGNEWDYEVVMVSPGLDCSKALKRKGTRTLLASCYEWLASVNARFRVIGIESSEAAYGGKGIKDVRRKK